MAQNYFGKTDSRGSTPVTYNFTPLSSAEPFVTTKPYTVGEYCFYEGILYRCKTDKAAGAWAPTKFEEANLGEHLTDAEKALLTKAEIDGYYDGMTVGNAEQIVGTVFEEDDTAYNYRTTGGSAEVGDRAYVDAITGVSLPWNQLVPNGNFATDSNWSAYTNGVATYVHGDGYGENTINSIPEAAYFAMMQNDNAPDAVVGHKYLYTADVNPSKSMAFQVFNSNGGTSAAVMCNANAWTPVSGINVASRTMMYMSIQPRYLADIEVGLKFKVRNAMNFDLTAMFGSTIADYIYGLETAHAGDGVAWFKRYFPKPYYAYHPVGMEHVNAVAAKTVGFNQFDKSTAVDGKFINGNGEELTSANYGHSAPIPVFPSTTYYMTGYAGNSMYSMLALDGNKNPIVWYGGASKTEEFYATLPANAYYVILNYLIEQKDDICISIRWDNSRDGDYEPYNLHTYPLADLTLRGIPKIDESGNLKFDGDRYLPDGTVERNKAEVTYDGSSDEAWGVEPSMVGDYYRFYIGKNDMKKETNYVGALIATLPVVRNYNYFEDFTGDIAVTAYSITQYEANWMYIISKTISTVADLRTYLAAHPVTIIYPLNTPTTEEADPYQYPMVVDNWGTEAFVDGLVESGDRDVAIPVGHETKYPPNLKDKLESAANNPDADGVYVLTHDGGSNTYTPLASNPTIQDIIARLTALEGGGENE